MVVRPAVVDRPVEVAIASMDGGASGLILGDLGEEQWIRRPRCGRQRAEQRVKSDAVEHGTTKLSHKRPLSILLVAGS